MMSVSHSDAYKRKDPCPANWKRREKYKVVSQSLLVGKMSNDCKRQWQWVQQGRGLDAVNWFMAVCTSTI